MAQKFSRGYMAKQKKKIPEKDESLVVPAGTEQETGFTRAETEKTSGPVKIPPVTKEETKEKGRKRSK
jgi:hypothetical protein